jgi:hypothetical protein
VSVLQETHKGHQFAAEPFDFTRSDTIYQLLRFKKDMLNNLKEDFNLQKLFKVIC